MENREIARLLSETADLMEIGGEDGFRIRSYRNAASAIEGYPRTVEDILAQSGPQGHRDSRRRQRHRAVLQEFVPARHRLKNAIRCWRCIRRRCSSCCASRASDRRASRCCIEHYKVATIDELERFCKEQKLRELPRMGAKLEEKVLKSIAQYRQRAGRFLLSFGEKARRRTDSVLIRNRRPGADRRRRKPAARQGNHRRSRSAGHRAGSARCAGAFREASQGPQRAGQGAEQSQHPIWTEGLQVDLRALPHESYGAAMQYFTGSKEHNIVLRSARLKLGLTLNEYGLFRVEDEQRVAGETEEEVYASSGSPGFRPNCAKTAARLKRRWKTACRS